LLLYVEVIITISAVNVMSRSSSIRISK